MAVFSEAHIRLVLPDAKCKHQECVPQTEGSGSMEFNGSDSHSHRWGLILAGGDGKRLLPLTRRIAGDDRPKQFCAVLGALTFGFITTMVFAIGQRVLPAFGGARVLYSPRLMLASLVTLTAGCALRVGSEIPAYERYFQAAWHVLPCSAVIELLAVSLFAANLLATFARPAAHLRSATAVN